MPSAAEVIKKPVTQDRSKINRGFTGQVDPEGGDRAAGLITGYSVTTRGEALGHGLWCDDVFLAQVNDALTAAGEAGVKSRFTHPGLSADGLGKFLGNTKNPTLKAGQVVADLHFSKSAHNTPDGDLAAHVMDMAENDPDKFGSSIVFDHDWAAAEQFMAEHTDETGQFKSPDPANVNNYPHCRLAKLRACDLVDDPAANPGGLFHRGQEIAQEATSLMEYALGLDDTAPPALAQFDVDPGRLKSFFDRFLDEHGLNVVPIKEETEAMTKEKTAPAETQTETPAAPMPTREEFTAELNRYQEKFGAENGAKWFAENKTMEEALAAQVDLLSKSLTTSEQTIKGLEEKLAAINTGESAPFESQSTENGEKKSFREVFNVPAKK